MRASFLNRKIGFGALAFVMASTAAPAADQFKQQIVPLLEQFCYDCHGDGAKKGGFTLDHFPSQEALLKDTKHWFSVWKNLQTQLMPPADKTQPPLEKRRQLLDWIESAVFHSDPNNPDPGRVTVRRMNREEYRNTIQDLLGQDFNTDDAFPTDDTGYGFDTIGDVLSISPLLMEKYLEAAQGLVGKMVFESGPRIPIRAAWGDKFRSEAQPKRDGRWMPLNEKIQAVQTHEFENPGRYRFEVQMRAHWSDKANDHTADFVLKVGDKVLATEKVGWTGDSDVFVKGEMDLPAGKQPITMELTPATPPGEGQKALALRVEKVEITGPLDGSRLEYTGDFYKLFPDGPGKGTPAEKAAYRRKVIEPFASRAFRRPVDEPTLTRLLSLAEGFEQKSGGKFEVGVAQALAAILASPRFIFRAEIQAQPNNPGQIVPIDDYALASRLSYFLWKSLPDDELLRQAAEGKLRANLRQQVDRMLGDGRSQRFVRSFIGQWLQTRDVGNLNIDAQGILGKERVELFYQASGMMPQETEMFFTYSLKENRPLIELLSANYTFLNDKLASFYGVPGVTGGNMRKVELPANSTRRGGILSQGSILMVTSNPSRTSPVKRGLFILENILGTPAPPAPPNVPEFEKAQKKGSNPTMREIMEIHRADALCASCHARMDPLGLALESFDATGSFRDQDHGKPIDTGGRLITGEKFANLGELVQVLATARKDDFYRCLSEKLLTYALGRGLEYYDTVTVNQLVKGLQSEPSTLRSLIYGVVESAPFQKRRGDGSPIVAASKPSDS